MKMYLLKYMVWMISLLMGCDGTNFEAISNDTSALSGYLVDTVPTTGDDMMPNNDETPSFDMLGFAAVPGLDGRNTTGGNGDPQPITVRSFKELQDAVKQKGEGPRLIWVEGTISSTEVGRILMEDVSDISIIGKNSGAELAGVGLSMFNVSNIVVRNLQIHNVNRDDGDAIRIVYGSHHVWIDHCEFYNMGPTDEGDYDGLIDITHASDYITISWNRFHDSFQGMLIGHDDANRDEDEGYLNVSCHHNVFENIGAGVPLVRFGQLHIWNNLYQNIVAQTDAERSTGLAVVARMGACVLIESTLFENVTYPVLTDFEAPEESMWGNAVLRDNEFNQSGSVSVSSDCYLDIPYEYKSSLTSPHNLRAVLENGAGVGKLSFENK